MTSLWFGLPAHLLLFCRRFTWLLLVGQLVGDASRRNDVLCVPAPRVGSYSMPEGRLETSPLRGIPWLPCTRTESSRVPPSQPHIPGCPCDTPYHFIRTKSPPRTARFRSRLTHQTRVNAAYNDSAEATLHWGDYEMIDWERVVSGELRASSYCVRKVNRSPIQSSWREKSNILKVHAEGGGS